MSAINWLNDKNGYLSNKLQESTTQQGLVTNADGTEGTSQKKHTTNPFTEELPSYNWTGEQWMQLYRDFVEAEQFSGGLEQFKQQINTKYGGDLHRAFSDLYAMRQVGLIGSTNKNNGTNSANQQSINAANSARSAGVGVITKSGSALANALPESLRNTWGV